MLGRASLAVIALLAPAFVGLAIEVPVAAEEGRGCQWLAGDLHVHTTYSHDSYGGPGDDNTGPDEAHTLGHTVERQFAIAASRDLDYLAITDHNDVRSQEDEGFGSNGVTAVGGYENSLRGHAQMLGAHEIYDRGAYDDDDLAVRSTAVNAMAEELRADAGLFQINHPAEGSTDFPHDTDWGYEYEVVPDSVEVWNISRLYQPPGPSASSNDDAVRYWEGWLDRGFHVTATGGSDNHWASTTAVQGVGQPTTWVCAPEPTEAGVIAGLRAGHTFISHQPPAYRGPRLFLEADGDNDGTFEAIAGDTVAPGSELRVRVAGAPGSFLRVVTDESTEVASPVPVSTSDFEHAFALEEDATWVRAEIFEPDLATERSSLCDRLVGSETTYCRNQLLVLAMTSALYFADAAAEATMLVYDGDTSVRVGDSATLAATLTDSAGDALSGEVVAFAFRHENYEAMTDESGRAAVTVRAVGPPGDYELVASYAGSEVYRPSEDVAVVSVEPGEPR